MAKKLHGRVIVPVFGHDDIYGAIPWIASIPRGSDQMCMGHRAGRPLYAYWKMSKREDEEPDYAKAMARKREEVNRKFACKLKARWVYIAENGDVQFRCTHHVYSDGLAVEIERFDKWLDEFYQKMESGN